jgi:hypothetical protein
MVKPFSIDPLPECLVSPTDPHKELVSLIDFRIIKFCDSIIGGLVNVLELPIIDKVSSVSWVGGVVSHHANILL